MSEPSRPTARGVPLALFLSGLAIGLSLVEALFYASDLSISNEVKRASMLPYIDFTYAKRANSLNVYVTNLGTGMAQMKSVHWRVDGEDRKVWDESVKALYADLEGFDRNCTVNRDQTSGRVISPGTRFSMMRIQCNSSWCNEKGSERGKPMPGCWYVWDRFLEHWKGLQDNSSFSACYCSVFNDCWESRRTPFHTEVAQIKETRLWYEVYRPETNLTKSERFSPDCDLRGDREAFPQ